MIINFKSILNLTWKVGLGLFGLTTLIIGLLIAYEWYDDSFGRYQWNDTELSKNVDVHCFGDLRVRVWNSKTGRYTTRKLNWVSATPEHDSLTVYCDLDGNRGYINCNTGEIVIPANKAKYRHAWHFSEGRAFVILPDEDSLSVIDHAGRIIVRNVSPYYSGYDYVFKNGLCELRKDGMVGLLGMDGAWAVEPDYFFIHTPNTFGYRLARNEQGYWLYDKELKLVYSEPYDNLEFAIGHPEGTGTLYRTRGHVKQLVNYDGSIVVPFVIDGKYNLSYMSGYNEDGEEAFVLDTGIIVYKVDDFEGLMDPRGRLITPAVYTGFEMISKDLIKATLSFDCESAVMLDRSGHAVNI